MTAGRKSHGFRSKRKPARGYKQDINKVHFKGSELGREIAWRSFFYGKISFIYSSFYMTRAGTEYFLFQAFISDIRMYFCIQFITGKNYSSFFCLFSKPDLENENIREFQNLKHYGNRNCEKSKGCFFPTTR